MGAAVGSVPPLSRKTISETYGAKTWEVQAGHRLSREYPEASDNEPEPGGLATDTHVHEGFALRCRLPLLDEVFGKGALGHEAQRIPDAGVRDHRPAMSYFHDTRYDNKGGGAKTRPGRFFEQVLMLHLGAWCTFGEVNANASHWRVREGARAGIRSAGRGHVNSKIKVWRC